MNLFNIVKSHKNRLKKRLPRWFWAIDLHDTIFRADYKPDRQAATIFLAQRKPLQLYQLTQQS